MLHSDTYFITRNTVLLEVIRFQERAPDFKLIFPLVTWLLIFFAKLSVPPGAGASLGHAQVGHANKQRALMVTLGHLFQSVPGPPWGRAEIQVQTR